MKALEVRRMVWTAIRATLEQDIILSNGACDARGVAKDQPALDAAAKRALHEIDKRIERLSR